jgi:hypothetical protein
MTPLAYTPAHIMGFWSSKLARRAALPVPSALIFN